MFTVESSYNYTEPLLLLLLLLLFRVKVNVESAQLAPVRRRRRCPKPDESMIGDIFCLNLLIMDNFLQFPTHYHHSRMFLSSHHEPRPCKPPIIATKPVFLSDVERIESNNQSHSALRSIVHHALSLFRRRLWRRRRFTFRLNLGLKFVNFVFVSSLKCSF